MNTFILLSDIGQPLQITSILIALALIAGLAAVLGALIMLISNICRVDEDPRIAEVTSCLAGSNCGACGHPGCSGFAKALVNGEGDVSQCGQTTKENKIAISNILGLAVSGDMEPTIAVVACAGGNKCEDKYSYQGYGDCTSQNLLAGGRKACPSGCMGSGTCVNVCPYGAITVSEGCAQVDKDLCRSCGLCIAQCPKGIIKRIPASAKVFVACSNHCKGREVMNACQSGCIACGICVKACPHGAIHMEDNVPVIDYSLCTNCMTCVGKCPRHIIRLVEDPKTVPAKV